MNTPTIRSLLDQVDATRLRVDLFHLCSDPLPCRKLNFTRPGRDRNTLYEADDFIRQRLETAGYRVQKHPVRVQCFRCDTTKPVTQQYSPPSPADPWYTAYNLSARKTGTERPGETLVVVSHKDSQSWCDSPGAYDNGVGTVGNLEIARILAPIPTRRSFWFLFCNEEHTPWTSITAANDAARRGEKLVGVFNVDSLGGKAAGETAKTNVTAYTTPEGERLAVLMSRVNDEFHLGLVQSAVQRPRPGDDDGSFIRAGFPAAVANLGSFPYADPNYHQAGDVAERVDVENVRLAVQATLAALLRLDGE